MKIALAQINLKVGDLENNSDKIISTINSTDADLVVFPELSIVGYPPQDLLLNKNFIKKNLECLEKIKIQSNKPSIIGFVDLKENKLFNSAAFIEENKIKKVHHKVCLPNYKIFDEKRYFTPGEIPTVFSFQNKKIGLNICEDIWYSEISKKQKESGAELIINISASPYEKNKINAIENLLKKRFEELNLPIIYVNLVGSQDGIIHYGHSTSINKETKKCKDFEEEILIVEVK